MGGVGHELALGIEGTLKAAKQPIEGIGEFLELVSGAGQGEALVQVARGDPPGGCRDRPQRAQHSPGNQPARRDGDQHHGRQGNPGHHQEAVQGGTELPESLRVSGCRAHWQSPWPRAAAAATRDR